MQGQARSNEDVQLKKSRGPQRRFLIGGVLIAAVVIYLVVSSVGGSTAYYLTVGELQAKGSSINDKNVRVAGLVQDGSVQYDARNLLLTFEVADNTGKLPVTYKGVRPDMFQGGAEAVIEGRLQADGTFQATNLLLKCPSKYEDAGTAQASNKE